MRSAQLGDCVLPPAGARRYKANHRGIEREHRAQCARVRRWREEHTLVKRQSWGLSNDGGLRMVNWESQSKPPQSPEDGHIYCILLIRIAFCHVSENLPLSKLATNHRALLRKITHKDKASYGTSPPCNVWRGANALRYEVVSSLVH